MAFFADDDARIEAGVEAKGALEPKPEREPEPEPEAKDEATGAREPEPEREPQPEPEAKDEAKGALEPGPLADEVLELTRVLEEWQASTDAIVDENLHEEVERRMSVAQMQHRECPDAKTLIATAKKLTDLPVRMSHTPLVAPRNDVSRMLVSVGAVF